MMKFAFYPSPWGYFKIGYMDTAISYLKCVACIDAANLPSPLSDQAFSELQEYLHGRRRCFDFPYQASGTVFQQKVWNALCDIPYGQTRTYQQIAAAIGSPNACRAVGAANRSNPIWIVIPCHRVIAANGTRTGYAGGLEMKQALLDIEQRSRTPFQP